MVAAQLMRRLPEHLPARLLFIALFGGFGALLINVGVETIQEGHPTQGALFIVGVSWVFGWGIKVTWTSDLGSRQ